MKRSITIDGADRELVLSKVTMIKNNKKEMIYLDKLDDGTWRLIYNEGLIPDLTKVSGFTIVREDD